MAFSNVLLSIMTDLDLTGADISRQTNLSEAIISKYLHGKSEPKLKTLKQMAEKLDVPLALLLEEPPFENIAFLNTFKAVILHGLNEQGAIVGLDDMAVSEVDGREYWKIIEKFFVKIEDKGGYLKYTYKTATFDDENPIKLKPATAQEPPRKGYQGTLTLRDGRPITEATEADLPEMRELGAVMQDLLGLMDKMSKLSESDKKAVIALVQALADKDTPDE